MAEYLVNSVDLSNVATAIRQKTGGANLISFPDEYISGIESLTNTNDATATDSDILANKTAYANGKKITGTMIDNGELNYVPSTEAQTIPAGYTSGGTVQAISYEDTLTPEEYNTCDNLSNLILYFSISN